MNDELPQAIWVRKNGHHWDGYDKYAVAEESEDINEYVLSHYTKFISHDFFIEKIKKLEQAIGYRDKYIKSLQDEVAAGRKQQEPGKSKMVFIPTQEIRRVFKDGDKWSKGDGPGGYVFGDFELIDIPNKLVNKNE